MVNTKKFSEFSAASLTTTTKKMAGISNSTGGENIIVDFTVKWTTAARPAPPYDGLLGYNTDLKQYEYYDSAAVAWIQLADNAVFTDAKFILQQPHASLPAAQSLSVLTTGILKSTTTSGVLSISAPLTSIDGLTTSADKMIYTTASNVYAVTDLTAFARTLLDDTSASAARTTLGLGQAAVKNVTDNTKANVASVTGAFTINHVLLAADANGTVKDGGSPAGMGTVTEIDTGVGLTGGPITTTGTIELDVPVVVSNGGTGNTTFTAYSLITAGITDTGAFQNVSGVGTLNQVLISQGAAALPIWASVPGLVPAALTKVDDTNVTLTLGGTPLTALLQAVSITAGWTGTLAETRGGTNQSTYTLGDTLYASAANTLSKLAGNTTAVKQYLSQTGNGVTSAAPAWATVDGGDITGAALTKTDDTNVTLSLGGSPTTALLRAASLTLGWTGQLAVSRGGTGLAAITAHYLPIGNGTSALTLLAPSVTSGIPLISQGVSADPAYGTAVVAGGGTGNTTFTAYSVVCAGTTATGAFQNVSGVGTSGQVLQSNGAAALPTWATIPGTTSAALTKADDTNVTLTLGGAPTTALLTATSITAGWTGQLGLTRGGTAASLTASNGGIVYSTASALAILNGTATAGQIIRSGASTTPSWSTATYPATVSANAILYGSSSNVVGEIATTTAGRAVLSATSVLVKRVTSTIAAANGTSNIPNDNTKPQVGEGTEIGTVSITPLSATNILVARFQCGTSNNTGTGFNTFAMFFSPSNPDAIAVDIFTPLVLSSSVGLNYSVVAGTTSSVTFSVRIGINAGTWYVSSNSSGITFGGLIPAASVLEVLEYTP